MDTPQNKLSFAGRVAVITGAGRGIGREHALLLASRGARVVVNNRSKEGALQTCNDIAATGGTAAPCVSDVSTREGARLVIEAAMDSFGRIDIVINNAGILEFKPFASITDAERDDMMNVHFTAAWAITQAAWPRLIAQKYGRVVMTISSAGLWGMPNGAHYCAAKAALVGLTMGLASEGGACGINVNAVAVGGSTRMLVSHVQDAGYVDWSRRAIPAWAASPPVCWLIHEDCGVSGQIFSACGRWMSRIFIGAANGFVSRDNYTLETIRDNFDQVLAHEPFVIYSNAGEHAAAVSTTVGEPFGEQTSLAELGKAN